MTAPYLWWSLALAALFAAWNLTRDRRNRSLAWSVAALAAFGAPTALLTEPEYWAPGHVATLGIGVEDVIFAAAAGGLAWLSAGVPARPVRVRPAAARFAWCYIGTVALGGIVRLAGGKPMSAIVLAAAGCTAAILWKHPSLLRTAMRGSIGFGAIYAVSIVAVTGLVPEFLGAWRGESVWGLRLRGVPVDEFVWGCVFGAAWPVVAAWTLGIADAVTAGRESRIAGKL